MRRLPRWLGVLAGLITLAAPSAVAGARGGPSAAIDDVQTQPGQVRFVLSVAGLAHPDQLDAKSVHVTADGMALPAHAVLSPVATPTSAYGTREVMLVIDASGSMEGAGIAAARSATSAYLTALPADVRLGVVTFANTPRVLVNPTTDRSAVRKAVALVVPKGETSLYDAIVAAVRAMAGPSAGGRRLVIMSDGDPDTSSQRTLSDAVEALNTADVSADVVTLPVPGTTAVLQQIAASSHGQVLAAGRARELAKLFAALPKASADQLTVTVQVPAELAGRRTTLTASLAAGSQTVTASTTVTLPAANAATTAVESESNHDLWLAVGLAALALTVIALAVVLVPGMSAQERTKKERLSEVGRYRIVETLNRSQPEGTAAAATQSALTKSLLAMVGRVLSPRDKRRTIAEQLERAGMRATVEEWVAVRACGMLLVGASAAVLMHSVIGLLVGILVAWFGFRSYLKRRISRRAFAFGEQLPDVLQLVAGSLRSGFSLNQAVAGVVSEGSEPTASEFARALSEARLGAQLEDAIDGVAERMRCLDLHLVVMAIRISREVGGNLAEVLLTTVATMRERGQLKREVKVLSAEGRLSAKILIGMPFMMLGFLSLFKPGYLRPMYSTGLGWVLIVMGIGALVTGSFWVNRLVKIEV